MGSEVLMLVVEGVLCIASAQRTAAHEGVHALWERPGKQPCLLPVPHALQVPFADAVMGLFDEDGNMDLSGRSIKLSKVSVGQGCSWAHDPPPLHNHELSTGVRACAVSSTCL